ncbi:MULTISPECIES: Bug family tripartite tricarboxylate transporter substrate binding protein [Giesbergeria]|uniref:Bug family tripartite tricarboxylate transporter substrate binding protein n=1 Tax=Giesbergeria sinuosa TaxID=80883 RepID=A0ABV9QDA5_9BURK
MKLLQTFKATLVCMAVGLSLSATAQDKHPIRILVGFPPGGSTDTVARVLADKLAVVLKQPVMVDNKPGAGGRLAVQTLKTSAPDGLTYMLAPNATPVFQMLLYPETVLKYNLLTDFTPVGLVVSYPLALAVSNHTGAKTAKEYADWVKNNPKDATFGSAGAGGHTHFTGLQWGKIIGQELQVVPYRGNGPLATDLLGGQIAAGIMTAGDIIQHQRSGKVRVVGQFGAKRSPVLPDVPTLMEQGYKLDAGDAWTGMWAPAKTPKAEIERMQSGLKHVLGLPEVREILVNKATLNPDFRSGEEMDKLQRKELQFWGPIIKESGFKPES